MMTTPSSSASCQWSAEENKLFENALAEFDEDAPDRWEKVAARVPEKTVAEVVKQYQRLAEDVELIESGLVPLPHYPEDNNYGGGSSDGCSEGVGREEEEGGKEKKRRGRNTGVRRKKKGVPWNEEEHRSLSVSLDERLHACMQCYCFDGQMNNAAEGYIHQSEIAHNSIAA